MTFYQLNFSQSVEKLFRETEAAYSTRSTRRVATTAPTNSSWRRGNIWEKPLQYTQQIYMTWQPQCKTSTDWSGLPDVPHTSSNQKVS